MSKVLTSLPVGERVGIAFSGGLDTSVAVAWMREKGAVPCTYTADLGQYDEPDIPSVPEPRARLRRRDLPRRRLPRRSSSRRGSPRSPAAPSTSAPPAARYFNTTPLGRAVTGTLLVRAMHEDGVDIWGDGSTFKGNDIERFYRYGLLANPALRIYKPWLDADFVTELGGRAEMSQWLTERDLPYRDSKEKAYSTDANIWGATHEAKTLEHLDVSLETVEPIMGVKFWDPSVAIEPEDVTVALRARPAGRDQRQAATTTRWRWCSRPTRSAAATGSACPTRSRTASSRRSRAGSTRRPAWRCCSIAYERLLNAIHNEDTIENYHAQGRRLGPAALRGPVARPAGADAPRVAAALGRLGRDRGGRRCGCGAARTTRSCAPTGPNFSYHPDKLSMERTDNAAFGPDDRIGQLTMRNLDIADSRVDARAVRRPAARPGPGARRERLLLGALPTGGADTHRGQPAAPGGRPRRGALDHAAMESGTD